MGRCMKTGLTILMVFSALLSAAQSRHIKRADKAYESQNYTEAVEKYKKAIPAMKKKAQPREVRNVLFKTGKAYLAMNQFEKALPWFKEAAGVGIYSDDLYFAYAEALTLNDNITEALRVYRTISERDQSRKAKKRIEALIRYDDSTQHIINIRNLNTINSKYSDYAPAMMEENLVFSSTRPEKQKQLNKRTAQGYSNLYTAGFDKNKNTWTEATPLSNKLNSRKPEGVFTYSPVTQEAFFMKCSENNKDCRILTTKFRDGEWQSTKKVTFNVDGAAGHPSISPDGQTLYFVSDMPGGYGGKDIWKVDRVDDYMWGLPTNLGPTINTKHDELFPHISGDSLLFFASDRPESFGGLDIFFSRIKGNSFSLPVHPHFPFNTLRDDFGVMLMKTGGLLTSNRNNIAQSDDIFAFDGFPQTYVIKTSVLNKEKRSAIEKAQITLDLNEKRLRITTDAEGKIVFKAAPNTEVDITIKAENFNELNTSLILPEMKKSLATDTLTKEFLLTEEQPLATIEGFVRLRETKKPMEGEKVSLAGEHDEVETHTDSSGKYVFTDVLPGKTYTIKIAKEGYFSESRKIDISRLDESSVFSTETGYDTDFLLTPIEKEKEIIINNIFYDFNKATLRPESRQELDKLASMLKETPQVIIQINAHTDARGSKSYNQRLSQRRAQTVVDYLTKKGIAPDRLFAKGYGESRLMVPRARTEAQHQLNRRTSFNVLAVVREKSSENLTNFQSATANENRERDASAIKQVEGLAYRVQLMVSSQKLPSDNFRKLTKNIRSVVLHETELKGNYKYELGSRKTYKEAVKLRQQIVNLGHQDCFITAYQDNERITVKEALNLENP